MAPPKLYTPDAEKQAAYRARRERTMVKAALDRLHARLGSLQAAVSRAADKGDTLALPVGPPLPTHSLTSS
jgi:hypothetical protein